MLKEFTIDVVSGFIVSSICVFSYHYLVREKRIRFISKTRRKIVSKKEEEERIRRLKEEKEERRRQEEERQRRIEEEREERRRLRIIQDQQDYDSKIAEDVRNEVELGFYQRIRYEEIYNKPYVYKIRKRFLNSYLHRWNNLNRWIRPFNSAGLYTVRDVMNCSIRKLEFCRKTVPGIGDKGYRILVEIKAIAHRVDIGVTYFTYLGNELGLKALN